jgi:hypothetical protein
VVLDPVDVLKRQIGAARTPCMMSPAAITPRGTALSFPSMTSAVSSL